MQYLLSVQSEWMKTRRTASTWLVIIGALFIPIVTIAIRLSRKEKLPALYLNQNFWQNHFYHHWQAMSFLLLPLGIILCVSLIAQLEYRNNTWKQLHTTPQSYTTIYFAKLTVILLMLLQFFMLFNLGMYFSALFPLLFAPNTHYPPQPIPLWDMVVGNGRFFVASLPIVAIQYLLSVRVKNFVVPLGAGIILLVASTFAISWKYGYSIPFTYTAYTYLQATATSNEFAMPVNIMAASCGTFIFFIVAGFTLYRQKKDKC